MFVASLPVLSSIEGSKAEGLNHFGRLWFDRLTTSGLESPLILRLSKDERGALYSILFC